MELSTSRCVLRPLAADDASSLHALWTTPGVRRFLWDDEIIPPARTASVIDRSTQLFAERKYGLWGAWSKDSAELKGFAGLWEFRDPPELELLYGVADCAWGHGYAGEIAEAVLIYAFDTLQMSAVRASTDSANTASIRVLEKLAFLLQNRAMVGGLDTVFFERQRPSAK